MACQIFSRTVYHDIGAKLNWFLQCRRCKCIIYNQQCAGGMSYLCNLCNIGNFQSWISWRFKPYKFCFTIYIINNINNIRCINVFNIDSESAVDMRKYSESTTVNIVNSKHFISGAQKFYYSVNCSKP